MTGHINAALKGLLIVGALAGHIRYVGMQARIPTGAAGVAMHTLHRDWPWPLPLPSTCRLLNKIKQF